MHIAAFNRTLAAPDMQQVAAGIPDANRFLGSARIRVFDKEDHHTFTSHLQLVSGGLLGARFGYASLRDAMFELGVLTRGERVGAAAVIEREGRYFGHSLKGRNLEKGMRAPLRPAFLESDENARVVELRVKDRFDRLRALVDGGWVHRFRG